MTFAPALPLHDHIDQRKGVNPSPPAETEPDLDHKWLVNAQVFVDEKTAKHAVLRQSFHAKEGQRIEALDVICGLCRRHYEDLTGENVCSAKVNNEHLIGGDQSVRAKRKHPPRPAGTIIMPAPRINRRGIDAYLRGEI